MRISRHAVLILSTVAALLTSSGTGVFSVFLPVLEAEFGSSRAAASLPFTLAMVCWGLASPFFGRMVDTRGARPVLMTGVATMAVGFLAVGLSQSLWQVSLFYGVLVGGAMGACGIAVVSVLVSKHFPGRQRAMAVGISQTASPANPLLLAPVVFWVVATWGWRPAALMLAAVLALVALPLVWLGAHDPDAESLRGRTPAAWSQTIHYFRRGPLVRLFAARFACGLGFFLIPHMVTLAISKGLSVGVGALGVSLFGAAAIAGSLLAGLLADRFGRGRVLGVTYFVRGVGAIALGLFSGNEVVFLITIMLAAGPVFGTIAVNNVMIFEAVGPRLAGMVMGLSFILHQVAAALAPLVGGMIFDLTGSYDGFVMVLGTIMLVAGALTYGMRSVHPAPVPAPVATASEA